jgi:molybdate transport system ATP-binding protein
MGDSACAGLALEAMTALRFNCRFRYPTGFSLNFAFVAEAGVTAIVGPSGSGKTTVLNLIAGLLTPDSGTIALNDRTLFDAQAKVNISPERRGVGYVYQDYQLFPHLSIEDNLRYGQRRAEQASADFDRVVEVLELADVLKRYPVSLSGGQKQRVAVGRAMLRGPSLLLLDEPLTALDTNLRASVAADLRRAIDELRIPTLLVSHDQDSINWLAHTTIVMNGS